MRFLTSRVLLLSICLISGCASKHMQSVAITPEATQLSENQSAVVFFRDTTMGGGIQAPVVEVVNGDIKLVSVVSANTKSIHRTSPGRHIYAIGAGEASNILDTDLAPGKYHYVRVDPKFGLMVARFKFEPLNAAAAMSAKEAKNIVECDLMGLKPESTLWFAENKSKMLSRIDDAVKRGDTSQEKDKALIVPSYGVDRFQ